MTAPRAFDAPWQVYCPRMSCPSWLRCLHIQGVGSAENVLPARSAWPEPDADGRCEHYYPFDWLNLNARDL